MKIESRGHVVLKVRSLERAEAFYHGILGLPIATRWTANAVTFFTEQAQRAMVRAREINPQLTLATLGSCLQRYRKEDPDLWAAGLQKAHLPQ